MAITTQTVGSVTIFEDITQNAGANVAVSIAVDYTGYMANVVSTLKSILATDQLTANTLTDISGTLTTISGTLTTISTTLSNIHADTQTIATLASGDGIHHRSPDEWSGGGSTMEVISVSNEVGAVPRITKVSTKNISESYTSNLTS